MPKKLDYDLWPSQLEVQAASAVFLRDLLKHEEEVRLPKEHPCHMSPNIALSCALAEVWRQGRRFQRDRDAKALCSLAFDHAPDMATVFGGTGDA